MKDKSTVYAFKSGQRRRQAGGGQQLTRKHSKGRKSISNVGGLRNMTIGVAFAYLEHQDPQDPTKTNNFRGAFPAGLKRQMCSLLAVGNGEAEGNGAVSPATISRYMESVDNWLGNRKYKEEIQPHFEAMMGLGISFEAAKPHIESGNLEFYKSPDWSI